MTNDDFIIRCENARSNDRASAIVLIVAKAFPQNFGFAHTATDRA
jgi:hypothetical protein